MVVDRCTLVGVEKENGAAGYRPQPRKILLGEGPSQSRERHGGKLAMVE